MFQSKSRGKPSWLKGKAGGLSRWSGILTFEKEHSNAKKAGKHILNVIIL